MSKIVVPGETLSDTPKPIAYGFTEGGKTYSSITGVFDEKNFRLIPIEGVYIPVVGDYVVGVVTDVKYAGYNVDIHSAYGAFLSNKETRDLFELGDLIVAKIKGVDEVKNVDLTDARKLKDGKVVNVVPSRVPRLIGKKSSMVNLVKDGTGTEIVIGKNGRIWLKGGNIGLATSAVEKIDDEAYTSGLTDRMAKYIGDNKQ